MPAKGNPNYTIEELAAACGTDTETILAAIKAGMLVSEQKPTGISIPMNPLTGAFIHALRKSEGVVPEGLKKWRGRVGACTFIKHNISVHVKDNIYYAYAPDNSKCWEFSTRAAAVNFCANNMDYIARAGVSKGGGMPVNWAVAWRDIQLLDELVPRTDPRYRLMRDRIDRMKKKSLERREAVKNPFLYCKGRTATSKCPLANTCGRQSNDDNVPYLKYFPYSKKEPGFCKQFVEKGKSDA